MIFVILSQVQVEPSKFADSLNMSVAARWKGGSALYLLLDGEYLYVSTLDRKVRVLDVSVMEDPIEISDVGIGHIPIGLAKVGNYLLVAAGYGGLCAVDISEPDIPELAGAIRLPDSAISVVTKGSWAFVAAGRAGVCVVNASDPSAMSLVSVYNTPGFARGLFLAGNTLFVADGDSGLLALDVSNPAKPRLLGQLPLPDRYTGAPLFAVDVAMVGRAAYVAVGKNTRDTGEVKVVRVPNPRAMEVEGYLAGPGEALGVSAFGNYVLLSAGKGGVRLIDERSRKEVAHYVPPDYTKDYVFDGVLRAPYVVAASKSGVIIYKLQI